MTAFPDFGDGKAPYTVGDRTYETYYKIFGDLSSGKRPLIVVHGGLSFSHDYLLPISDLASSHGVPVVFYDQVGAGLSTHVRERKGDTAFWTFDFFIEESLNLLAHLKIEEYDYLGHSWGGILGQELVLRKHWHPKGMRNFILANTIPNREWWNISFMQLLEKADIPEQAKKTIVSPSASREERWAAVQLFYAQYGCMVQPFPEDFLVSMAGHFGEDADTTTDDAMNAQGGELHGWDVRDKLGDIDVPTLVINGARDFAQDWIVAPFVEKISGVNWVKFEHSSHTPFWEERNKFNQVVAEYLGYN
ncbi:Alpha/Beta hydrolase protein [Schizophyllum commune]